MSWHVVELEGRKVRVAVARGPRGVWVGWPGGAAYVQRAEQARAGGAAAEDSVSAPMTGKVVMVRVAPGDVVKTDDVLVVLEAMKMEYRLTAPRDGTVRAVSCKAGELVDLGATLVELA